MVNIIIATMVKDEDDIIEYWIKYYGNIFGYKNLYIIDNLSNDNTYNICKKYIKFGINLCQKNDYLKKGDYMMEIKNKVKCDFFIPVDIDEFIILKENNQFNCNIINYFNILQKTKPNNLLFKMNYIFPYRTNNDKNIIKQFTHGYISDYGSFAKSFIQNSNKNNIKINHGNHIMNNNYESTNLFLIHYHRRSSEQFKKKVINNVKGLNYILDINYLEKLLLKNKDCCGNHHVRYCIDLLKNKNKDFSPKLIDLQKLPSNNISLSNYINFIDKL